MLFKNNRFLMRGRELKSKKTLLLYSVVSGQRRVPYIAIHYTDLDKIFQTYGDFNANYCEMG